ncbi:hypothetical protein IFR05_016948 [Cadophora sp. M221]|nr:hypothetical protein IFR05_016948 [Cadophora sp. M221]
MVSTPDNPQGQYDGMYGLERTPYVEMAIVREYRRVLNRRRRPAVEQARGGIRNVDPDDPNPNRIPPLVMPRGVMVNPDGQQPTSPGPAEIDDSDSDSDSDSDDEVGD